MDWAYTSSYDREIRHAYRKFVRKSHEKQPIGRLRTIKNGKVIPVLNLLICHENVWGSGGIAPPFFDP
jgi:hypothetical protein